MSDMGNGYERGQPDISWWVKELNKGIAYRKKYAQQVRWPIWRDYYRNKFNKDVLPVNLFFRMIRTIVPRVYFRNPSISITATQSGEEAQVLSHIMERVDNKLLRTMKMKKQIKSIVQDAFMFGTGVGKLGYGAMYQPVPVEGENTQVTGKRNEVFEYSSLVQDNMPWFMRVPTGDFIVPADTIRYESARWSAVWTTRDSWDVQNDPRLSHAKDLKGSMATTGNRYLSDQGRSPKKDVIDLVEVRDLKFRKVMVLAPFNTDKILYYEDDETQVNGRMTNYPLIFNEDDEVFWGIPDSAILEPQQLEINEIRTLMMKHRRVCIVKLLAKRKSISEEEAAKLVDSSVEAVIWTEEDPRTNVLPLQIGNIPKDLFSAGAEIENDVRENVGFSRNQTGNYAEGSADRTATEARIVEQAMEVRVDERKDMVADLLEDVVEDMHQVIFNHWNEEQVIDVAGPDGLPVWVAFKPKMLSKGKYQIDVDPDSAVPETAQIRQARAFQVYQELKQNPLIDPIKLTKYFLHELPGTEYDNLLRDIGQQGGGQPGTNPQNPLTVNEFADNI